MKKWLDKTERALRQFSTGSFVAGVLFAVIIAAAGLLIWLYLPVSPHPSRPDSLAAMKKVSEAESIIREKFIEEVDEYAQTDAMIRGLVENLDDRYAKYYTKEEYEEVQNEHAGLTKGIGVQIAQETEGGDLVVVFVMEDSPAERAGVLENDRILAINGESMAGKSSTDAADRIQSIEGTVTLTIRREGEESPFELDMEKEAILESRVVMGAMMEGDIGYIRIASFNGLTAEQFKENYTQLQDEGMKALIIDLRNNLGGLVYACCETVEQILPEGPIMYEQGREGGEKSIDSEEDTPIRIPLVLLVNGYTASASEIFTGAVRDYGLATIVGEQTYGKGIEQNTYLLSDGSALKLTTTVYYTPEHFNLNGVGITPDVIVPLADEEEEDLQLDKAIEILSGQLDETQETEMIETEDGNTGAEEQDFDEQEKAG